jgi:hypothetical protein
VHASCDQNQGDYRDVDDVKYFVLALSKEDDSRKNEKHGRSSYHTINVFSQEKLREIFNPCPLKIVS